MKYFMLLVALTTLMDSCTSKNGSAEDAFIVAQSYCDCIAAQLVNAKDSSVDTNDCQRNTFAHSRLLMIYADFDNRDKYDEATVDSAVQFARLVSNIEYSLCNNKIDRRKLKRFRCRLQ